MTTASGFGALRRAVTDFLYLLLLVLLSRMLLACRIRVNDMRLSFKLVWSPARGWAGLFEVPREFCGKTDHFLRLGDALRGVSTVGMQRELSAFQTPRLTLHGCAITISVR